MSYTHDRDITLEGWIVHTSHANAKGTIKEHRNPILESRCKSKRSGSGSPSAGNHRRSRRYPAVRHGQGNGSCHKTPRRPRRRPHDLDPRKETAYKIIYICLCVLFSRIQDTQHYYLHDKYQIMAYVYPEIRKFRYTTNQITLQDIFLSDLPAHDTSCRAFPPSISWPQCLVGI